MRIAATAIAVLCCVPLAIAPSAFALANTQAITNPDILAVLRAGRGVRLTEIVTHLLVRTPNVAGDVVGAVNLLLAGAHSAKEKRSLADSAALGFVRAKRILLASGRTAEALAISAALDAEGDPLLVEEVSNVASLPYLSTAGGPAPVPLAPDAFGGGAGGAEVSPTRP